MRVTKQNMRHEPASVSRANARLKDTTAAKDYYL